MIPSNPSPLVQSMIRVNQAGEYGAKRIYEGQLAVLIPSQERTLVEEMLKQEEHHLSLFNELAHTQNVPLTKLTPLWHYAGFGLGVVSALLGKKALMACTVAVEDVIDDHYQSQLKKLQSIREDYEPELQSLIDVCHQDEIHHRTIALDHHAANMPGYDLFKGILKVGIRVAIELSKRF